MGAMLLRKRAAFLLLFFATASVVVPRPQSFENKEREAVMKEIKGLSSVISLINVPEDDTPKDSMDEDDDGSGVAVNAKCRDQVEQKNSTVNETQDKPDLVHANFDSLCNLTENGSIKKLPVYLVGWGLKDDCGEINTIPYRRFRMEEYKAKQPRFDIPGMCIPLKGKEMTLLMVDPDAPSKKSHRCRSWLHWMVVNIKKGNVNNGKEIISYKPPMPPYGSGPHRYFFLLYEQNHHINEIDDSENNMAERCGFNVKNFAEDNSLVGPVALNMFLTERKSKEDDKPDEKKDKKKVGNKLDVEGKKNKDMQKENVNDKDVQKENVKDKDVQKENVKVDDDKKDSKQNAKKENDKDAKKEGAKDTEKDKKDKGAEKKEP
eukprot:gene12443-3112_t